jgi:hypothetical protein
MWAYGPPCGGSMSLLRLLFSPVVILTGFLVPMRVSGRFMLKAELRNVDVDLAMIPEPMLDEVVTHSISFARALTALTENMFTEEFNNSIRANALRIAWYLRGDPLLMALSMQQAKMAKPR